MTAFLDGDSLTVALCWRLERRDGVAMGFTAHDRPLLVDGFLYRATPGIVPSAIEAALPAEGGAVDLSGALSADAITAADLQAGRWDGAAIRLLAVDWTDPARFVELARGTLGPVRIARGQFHAALRGVESRLAERITEVTSPECRAELGDRRCRVDLAGRRRLVRVVAAAGAEVTLDRAEPAPNAWGWGRLRWLDGDNGGLAEAILASAGATVTLAAAPRFPLAPGDRAEIIEGCDKSFATCRDRFGNWENFRGEPHLPGTDLLTRYPGE